MRSPMVSKHHYQQLDVCSHSGIQLEDNEDNEDDITSEKDLSCMAHSMFQEQTARQEVDRQLMTLPCGSLTLCS